MKKLKLGKAFPDEFIKTSDRFRHYESKNRGGGDWQESLTISGSNFSTSLMSSWRKLFLSIFLIVILTVFLGRIFHLQVVLGKENRELADSNRIQIKVIHAPRGVVYDRNGKILAQNEPGFRLVEASGSGNKVTYIDRDQALKMEAENDPKYKNLEIDSKRSYAFLEKTSHILGYVSEITADELRLPKYKNYKIGDKIGRDGIEEAYESVLKGVDGGEIFEVDAAGNKLRTLRRTEPIPGQNLYLTIDADLQNTAYKSLEEGIKKAASCCGALVAQDPNSGQILALVSIPSYNPTKISEALVMGNYPMLNRVIGGVYPPGSTYKIASSLAGLESGKITKSTIYEDTGVVQLGPYKFANWYFSQYGRTEGPVDVVKALQRSNDIFFYRLGETVGEKVIADASYKLGMGKKLGVDIPGEVNGTIPSDEWKRENIGEVWFPGDTLHMSIGQGFVLTTPLQISNLISAVAANGKQFPPHLAWKITDPKGETIKEFKYQPFLQDKFSQENLNIVKQGLEQVPKDGGTAWPFFNFPVATAGKTGTAEFGDPAANQGKYRTHAWYTAYGPVEKPDISITVLIEAGGEGSTNASPVAKEVFRWYFSPDKTNLLKDVAPIASESARILGE